MRVLLVLAVVALSAMSVLALKHKSVEIPSAGEVFGPIEKRNPGFLKKVGNEYHWGVTSDDVIFDIISSDMVFHVEDDMFKFAEKRFDKDSAVVQIDPYELAGKHIEILTVKPVTVHDLRVTCHASYPGQYFCHDFSRNGHINKFAYAVVKRMDNQRVFPAMFYSHKACNKETCFWVTHLSDITLLNKSIITSN